MWKVCRKGPKRRQFFLFNDILVSALDVPFLLLLFLLRPIHLLLPSSLLPSHFTASHPTTPHLTAPHLTSPHLTAPHLTTPHLTAPHLTAPHLIATSPFPTSPLLTSLLPTSPLPTSPFLPATSPLLTSPSPPSTPHLTTSYLPFHLIHCALQLTSPLHYSIPSHSSHSTAPDLTPPGQPHCSSPSSFPPHLTPRCMAPLWPTGIATSMFFH